MNPSSKLCLGSGRLKLSELTAFALNESVNKTVEFEADVIPAIQASQNRLYEMVERKLPIYGVTTGFGDSCFRFVDPSQAELLQANLVQYLLCGSGPSIPKAAARAMFAIRLKSLARGYSGVSIDLLERMRMYLQNDWIPVVPCEGSLGASGDLIPLAYLAEVLQGRGEIYIGDSVRSTAEVLAQAGIAPYTLKVKEGLALVNGTSAMAGYLTTHLVQAKTLLELAEISTAWLTMALRGRTEPFGVLVNDQAGQHRGQSAAAFNIRTLLEAEGYTCTPLDALKIQDSKTSETVQDRYSLRCAPQILGPVRETLALTDQWLEDEVNSTTDNPLLGRDGSLGMGGNFYGGYLCHALDYIKICLAQIADMQDRQFTTLMDEKSNRGLPANLANWPGLPESMRHLHHGLKGLHQAVSAITSEIMSKAIPNGIFSRSSESHNQDKVSLGMSAAVQCGALMNQLFTTQTMYLVGLCQALDLRGVRLQGHRSQALYDQIRSSVPFVTHDQALDRPIRHLSENLRRFQ